MEPAKMKTHHGYFLGNPMSAVGTKRTAPGTTITLLAPTSKKQRMLHNA